MKHFSPGPVKLRDGSVAYIDFVQLCSERERYLGRVKLDCGKWSSMQWTADGKWTLASTNDHGRDLACSTQEDAVATEVSP